ncbi:MAG TPA: HupE/UreJ family protein [Caldimonas sp.]|nr:HupE/UreJ family protein [Caldimonas sp.]HEX2542238.1 HupE/UreJ family protein [Caldimonas sp.]
MTAAASAPPSRGEGATHWRRALVALVLLLALLPAWGHDIPGETRVHAFAKVERDRLHVLLRIPLSLLLNVDLPKQGPGYLALANIDEGLARAVRAADKDIRWLENDRPLALAASSARISLPSDTSFGSYAGALALLRGPRLAPTEYVFWNQGYFDAHLEYPIESPNSAFSLDFRVAPGLRDRLKLDLRFLTADGRERAYDLSTGRGPVVLDPRWYQAAATFVASGFQHVVLGPDHLLFLVCLILPFRRLDGYLVGVVTAFAVGHSVTLIAAAYGFTPAGAWFAPLVEVLIAASILFMAIENVLRPKLQRRWVTSGLFGLVHGFGFAAMLQSQLQFAGSSLLVSLLAFNIGIEGGQLLVLATVLPAVMLLRRRVPDSDRAIAIIVGLFAGHVALHWLTDRMESLWKASDLAAEWLPIFSIGLLIVIVTGWAAWRGLGALRVPDEPRSAPASGPGMPT